MPAYTLNGVGVLYFAGWKSHYSLDPASDALVEAFAKELARYERSKGTLKFPIVRSLVPVWLIERIARFRARQLTARAAALGPAQRRTGRTGRLDTSLLRCASQRVREDVARHRPRFFVEQGKGCFAMFSEHHPDDWLAVALGAGGGRPAVADD